MSFEELIPLLLCGLSGAFIGFFVRDLFREGAEGSGPSAGTRSGVTGSGSVTASRRTTPCSSSAPLARAPMSSQASRARTTAPGSHWSPACPTSPSGGPLSTNSQRSSAPPTWTPNRRPALMAILSESGIPDGEV